MLMIDYYYEFTEASPAYGVLRGYHLELNETRLHDLHHRCWLNSSRVWLENANGITQVKDGRRDVHRRVSKRDIVWIKLLSQELEP